MDERGWLDRRFTESPFGRVLVQTPRARYLNLLDQPVRTLGLRWVEARLWIAPDELRVERNGRLRRRVARDGVVGMSLRWGGPFRRRLTMVTADGVATQLCLVWGGSGGSTMGPRVRQAPSTTAPRIREALALAGWPTDEPVTPAPWAAAIPPGTWWCRGAFDGKPGWLVVEPDAIGFEAPGIVGGWSRAEAPQIRLGPDGRGDGDATRVEVRVVGGARTVLVVPAPAGRRLAEVLDAGGWSPHA